ncbi:MAG: hypothetical protein K2V38_19740 [Gemmataceae bacterium]|nr:hypothetical protein [Gemmataceae bacterium]
MRPALLDRFDRVEIVSHDGQESLLTANGRPRGERLSDHLPISCELTS